MTTQEKLAKLDEAIDTMKEVLAALVSMRDDLENQPPRFKLHKNADGGTYMTRV